MKVRIYRPHTHAGIRYTPGPEGVELEVSKQVADFLEKRELTKRPEPKPAADFGKGIEPIAPSH